jgi:hypothetical protein
MNAVNNAMKAMNGIHITRCSYPHRRSLSNLWNHNWCYEYYPKVTKNATRREDIFVQFE